MISYIAFALALFFTGLLLGAKHERALSWPHALELAITTTALVGVVVLVLVYGGEWLLDPSRGQ